jgi:hypothetical protein
MMFVIRWLSSDEVRSVNAFLAAVGWGLLVAELRHVWHRATPARRLRYISIQLFALTICYGSLEQAYWPQYQFRVLLGFLAVSTMVVAGVWASHGK